MKEMKGNLWDYYNNDRYLICITTNGFVKRNGDAVCGRGCAYEATQRIENFARILGERIQKLGNVAGVMQTEPDEWGVFVFPVKHRWWEEADKSLIVESARTLANHALQNPQTLYILPRPGCGNGRLQWTDVKPLIEFLPDNVFVIDR